MRVISRKRLREFWESHANSKTPLKAWYAIANSAEWTCWDDLEEVFPNADQVGNCVVFNIGGNNYRLIARMRYPVYVYVLKIMTHAEYNKDRWPKECGCHKPPPKKKTTKKKTSQTKKKKRRKK